MKISLTQVPPVMRAAWDTRQFSPEAVPAADLAAMLSAAAMSCERLDEFPARFFVAQTAEEKALLKEYMLPNIALWMMEAPVLIFIVGACFDNPQRMFNHLSGMQTGRAVAFFSLAAEEMGYRTHFVTDMDRNDIKERFAVTGGDYDVYGILAVGKPLEAEKSGDAAVWQGALDKLLLHPKDQV